MYAATPPPKRSIATRIFKGMRRIGGFLLPTTVLAQPLTTKTPTSLPTIVFTKTPESLLETKPSETLKSTKHINGLDVPAVEYFLEKEILPSDQRQRFVEYLIEINENTIKQKQMLEL